MRGAAFDWGGPTFIATTDGCIKSTDCQCCCELNDCGRRMSTAIGVRGGAAQSWVDARHLQRLPRAAVAAALVRQWYARSVVFAAAGPQPVPAGTGRRGGRAGSATSGKARAPCDTLSIYGAAQPRGAFSHTESNTGHTTTYAHTFARPGLCNDGQEWELSASRVACLMACCRTTAELVVCSCVLHV